MFFSVYSQRVPLLWWFPQFAWTFEGTPERRRPLAGGADADYYKMRTPKPRRLSLFRCGRSLVAKEKERKTRHHNHRLEARRPPKKNNPSSTKKNNVASGVFLRSEQVVLSALHLLPTVSSSHSHSQLFLEDSTWFCGDLFLVTFDFQWFSMVFPGFQCFSMGFSCFYYYYRFILGFANFGMMFG